MAENIFDQSSLIEEQPNFNLEEQQLNEDQTQVPQQLPQLPQTPDNIPGINELANQSLKTFNTPDPIKKAVPNPIASVPSIDDLAKVGNYQVKANDPFYGIRAATMYPASISKKEAERWDDPEKPWHPGVDMDDWYGRDKNGKFSNLGRGAGRLTAGFTFKLGETAGYVGSLAYNAIGDVVQGKWNGTDIIDRTASNGFSKIFQGLEDDLKNKWIPTYQEAEDRGKGFWYRAFHDGDFWMDDVVDGVAFMASAWVPGIALSKLGLGTRVAKGLSRFRIGASQAELAIEGAGDAANYLSKANTLFKTSIDKYTAWGLATASESLFEAAGVKDKIYESLSYDDFGAVKINPDTLRPYTEEEKKKIAGANTRNVFLLNAALLSGTNLIELNWLGSAIGGAAEKGVVKGITGATTLADELALEKGPVNFFSKLANGKVGAFVKGGSKGIFYEGFLEENGQLAIQRINEAYGAKGKISNVFNVSQLFRQYANQTSKAIQGKDTEAAENIGIGGILGIVGGGRSALKDLKKDREITNFAVGLFNNTQQSFLKFGNIYKMQETTETDRNGVEFKKERVVFDEAGNPEHDEEKMLGVLSGYHSVLGALDESEKVKDKFKRDVLRDTAWAEYVQAHITAGIENTISDKLENIRKASPEELAKLGFAVDDTLNDQITRYKTLAQSIINQNKLMNSDILFDSSKKNEKIEQTRKTYLTSLASQQAIFKNLLSENISESEKIKNQLYDITTSSLSDGIVDQLNAIEYRIQSQKELIDNYEKIKSKPETIKIAKQILNELNNDKAELLKQNELSVKDLKKDQNGLYLYEKDRRNEPGIDDQYIKKIKIQSDLKNHIRSLALEWAKYADTINGMENFVKFIKNENIAPIIEKEKETAQSKKSKDEEPKPKEKKNINDLLKNLKGFSKEDVEEEEEEEEGEEATITYDEDGEEKSFNIKENKTYRAKGENGKYNNYTIVKINFENDSIVYKLNDEDEVDMNSEEFAKFANDNNLKEAPKTPGKKEKKKAPVKKKEPSENPREIESDIDIEEDPEAETYSSEGKKPKFEDIGFNKTFGRHYIDDADKELNTENGSDRFFSFTSKYDTSSGEYALKVVTKSNDDFKIRQSEEYPDDIKVIVVKKTKNKKGQILYNYIDQNNEIIPDDEATSKNIIYMSLPNIKNWTPELVRDDKFAVDESTNDDAIQEQIDIHTKYQNDLVKRTKKGDVYLDVIGNSPGIQRIEYTDSIDKDGNRIIAMSPVEGRVIVENPDWSELRSASNPNNFISLRVNTKEGALAPGLLPGRLVLQEYTFNKNTSKEIWTTKTTRVFNRKLNDEEKATIIQSLARFSELFGRKEDNPLSTNESMEYTLILNYLKGILNWSTPIEGRDPSKYVWIDKGLHVGDAVYKFDKESIIKNSDSILDGMYHHVNNRMLYKNNKVSFQTIKFVKGKAVADVKYETYQEYLLSPKEEGDIPPVYTSLPLVDSDKPQRTSVYLMWRDPAHTEAAPLGKLEERTYTKEYKEYKEEKKNTPKVFTKVDAVINNFINYRTKSIKIYNVEIKHIKQKKQLFVSFKNLKTLDPVKVIGPYNSEAELVADKYKLRALIYKNTGYNPKEKTTTAKAKTTTTKQSSKTKKGIKGEIKIALIEDGVMDGTVTTTTRNSRWHDENYKGDGVYKTESGNLVNLVSRGLIKYKPRTRRIWGKDINISKNEFAELHGFEDWNDFVANAKYSDAKLIEGKEAVQYYNITPYEEGDELNEAFDEEEEEPKQKTKKPIVTSNTGLQNLYNLINKITKGKTSTTTKKETKKETKPKRTVEGTRAVKEKIELAKKRREATKKEDTPLKELNYKGEKYYNIDDAVENAIVVGDTLKGFVFQQIKKTNKSKLQLSAEIKIINGKIDAAKNQLRKALSSQLLDDSNTEAPFRLSLNEIKETEDFKKLSVFMNTYLPQFSVNKMNHLIHNKAWGMFYKGAIYIYEKAGYGTGFHEAFEAVWASYLTDEERMEMADEFRKREGNFYNPFTNQTKAYSDASMYDVKEILAEEFIKHADDTLDESKIGNKILNFFKELWNSIKAYFNLSAENKKELNSKINDVFKSVTTGKFVNAKPIRDLNVLAPEFRSVGDLSQKETASILEGINYYFFKELFSRGNNINTILNPLTKEESNTLLSSIYTSSFDKVLSNLDKILRPTLKAKVEAYKVNIYDVFKDNLQKYGITFDSIEIEEDKINNPLGIVDSISIDPRKMTGSNTRLLLASLPEIVYNKKGNESLKINDLGQPKLVNADKIHVTLLNELSNISAIVDQSGKRINVLDQMMDKLDLKYLNKDGTYRKGYAWISSLKRRLKYEDVDGTKIDGITLSQDEIELKINFIKSFNNIKSTPNKTIVGAEGYIYDFNSLDNVNIDRVKYNWSNNLKIQVQNNENGLITLDKTGKLIINRKSNEYSDLVSLLQYTSDIDLDASLFILQSIGIEFSASDEELKEYESDIKENAIQILSLINEGELNTINDIYGTQKISGRINKLLNIEADFTSEDNNLSYLTPEGEQQYAVGIPSLFSQMINILNTVSSHAELINTCPWLGYFEAVEKTVKGKKVTEYVPVLNPYQQNSDLLKKGGALFDKNGNRKQTKKLVYNIISGMGATEVEGTSTDALQFPERVSNKIHFLLKGFGETFENSIVFSNINSDKSTEFGISIPKEMLITREDVANFISKRKITPNSDKIVNKYVDQLSDEMAAAVLQKEDPTYIVDYSEGVNRLGHFRNILSDKLINKFKSEVLSEDAIYEGMDAPAEFINDNRAEIEKDITSYIVNTISNTTDFLLDLDIFEVTGKNKNLFITDAISNSMLNSALGISDRNTKKDTSNTLYNGADINILAGMLAINEEILITEQHKLIYGHPAMYNDLAKRVSGATATKESFVEDSDIISWQDKNMPRNDGKIRSEEVHQTTKIISFKNQDVISMFYKDIAEGAYEELIQSGVSEKEAEERIGARFEGNQIVSYIYDSKGNHTGIIKNYIELDETDGMAWGMPDTIRDILFSTGKLTPQQQAQWDYEIAYEKLVRSGKILKNNGTRVKKGDPEYKKYDSEELLIAENLVSKGDPSYIFQVLKPQYFGYADSYALENKDYNSVVTHPVFLKHAVQPKFYRHVEGTQYESLYLAAQRNQVDIIGFKSGQKVGTVTDTKGKLTPVYDMDNGMVNTIQYAEGKTKYYDLPPSLPQLKIYSKFYGIQVETSNKAKNSVVRGTQITKLIMVNFFENGKPINEEIGNLVHDYLDTLKKMIRLGKEDLIKELGLVRTDQGYDIKDLSKLIGILRNEAIKRELPDNVIDAINSIKHPNGEQELKYPFDTLINKEKIDNILNSIVDSRVISAKMHGKSSVQVSSALYESNPRNFMFIRKGLYTQLTEKSMKTLTEEEKKSIKMMSSDLKFYYKKDGSIQAMETYISFPFSEVTPEELGLKLENGIYKIPDGGIPGIDNTLLKAIGFRIPTSGMNMVENIIIKGFTPATNGDMIVIPSEAVGKAGSDFDIDKINLYFKIYSIDGVDYSTDEFRKFMIKDFVEKGNSRKDSKKLIDSYTVEDFKKINRATFSEEGRLKYDAPFSLLDLDIDDYTTMNSIKKSIQKYNRQYKGKKRVVYTQPDDVTKDGLHNKFISIMNELMSRSENYGQLISPNTTANLKKIATDINNAKIKAKTKTEEDERSFTYLRTFVGASVIRERYLTAKRMVGIGALHATLHSIAQVSGLKISNKFKTKAVSYLMPKMRDGSYAPFKEINIKLSHHPQDEDGYFNIGYKTDVQNNIISDLFGESISGFVDGAKDPFVFDLNLSMNSAGTWFYLQHLGVPAEEIGYFFSQPIMDDYFSNLQKNRSNFKVINNNNLYREELMHKVITPYYDKVFNVDLAAKIKAAEADKNPFKYVTLKKEISKNLRDLNNQFSKFDLKTLKSEINKGKRNNPKFQLAVLFNYLEYEAQSRLLSNFMQAISYDNKKTKTIQENQFQVSKWTRSLDDEFIVNPESVLDETFLGEMKEQKEDIFNMFEKFFITLKPEVQKVFEPLYSKINNPDYFGSQENTTDLINRYQNFIITYLLHTTPYVNESGKKETLNKLYRKLFLGRDNIAKRLMSYKKSDDPEISENLVIKELIPLLADDKNQPNNISLFRNKLDTFETNNVIEALDNLKDYAENIADDDLSDFVNDLAKFVILQSGMQTSAIDYKKILSTRVYSDLVKTILDNFTTTTEIDVDDVWRNFHANNWTRQDIVPVVPKWIKVVDGVIAIKEESSMAVHDYLVKTVLKVEPSKLAKMRKEKNLEDAFEKILFEKTNERDEKNKIIYQAVNKQGFGRRLVEIHKGANEESIIPSNNIGYTKPNLDRTSKQSEDDSPAIIPMYSGGFSNAGKGTSRGDGKDKAMRKIADAAIVELSNNEPSSSKTTIDELGDPDYTKELYSEGMSEVIMLARNGQLKNRPLRQETLDALDEAIENGAVFIVGDMPGVDSPFIEYLLRKGAAFRIFGSSKTPGGRIAEQMPELWRKVVRKGVSFEEDDETEVSTKESEKENNLIPVSDAEKIDLSAYLVGFQMMNNGDLNKTVDRWLSKVDTDKATFNKMLDALLTNKFIKRDAGSYLDILRDVGNEWFDKNKQLSNSAKTNIPTKKIISGAQTGVDSIGLEIAKKLGYKTGGTAPIGFLQEGTKNPSLATEYGIKEISAKDQAVYTKSTGKTDPYTARTQQNVINSDGTVYFFTPGDTMGRDATKREADKYVKPFIENPTASELKDWLNYYNIETLNVAGNRGSKLTKQKEAEVRKVLEEALGVVNTKFEKTNSPKGRPAIKRSPKKC